MRVDSDISSLSPSTPTQIQHSSVQFRVVYGDEDGKENRKEDRKEDRKVEETKRQRSRETKKQRKEESVEI